MPTEHHAVRPAAGSRLGFRAAAARKLAESHPAGLMHGAVVMGAVLALIALTEAAASQAAGGSADILVIYWLTHAYTDALGHGMGGSDRLHLFRRLLRFGRRDMAVLFGGLPAPLVFWLATLLGAGLTAAVNAALWLTVLLLTLVGYLAAHLAGITGWRLVGETGFAALMGAGMIALNTFLH